MFAFDYYPTVAFVQAVDPNVPFEAKKLFVRSIWGYFTFYDNSFWTFTDGVCI